MTLGVSCDSRTVWCILNGQKFEVKNTVKWNFFDFRKMLRVKKSLHCFPEDFPSPLIRNIRNGRDFDTLLGRSFGTSKRRMSRTAYDTPRLPMGKKNFDEIDNAGFSDYLHKRISDGINSNWDQWTPAGKRNFDEIDNAGFKDYLYKRQPPDVDPPWDVFRKTGKRNFDEIDNAGFKDYLYKRQLPEADPPWTLLRKGGKRNFDEIDNAGFKDYLYKRRPKGSRVAQQEESESSEAILVQ